MSRALKEPVPHDEAGTGRAIHRVIGRFLEEGASDPSPEEIMVYAAREAVLADPHVYGLAARQRVVAGAAIYLRRLLPPSPPWKFVEYGTPIPGSDLDLVFRHSDGRVIADELKTGAPVFADGPRLDRQLKRELEGGRERYGRAFAGIRVAYLGAPARSFFVDGDGGRSVVGECMP